MQVYKQTTKINGEESAYRYTYDANGNITSVNDGTYTTTYVYDSANQLLRENNEKAGKTWGWTYDDGGNIRTKTEYAYTTGTVGEALDTVTYNYSASSWGDLLTSHDGNAITSDANGNMLSYGDEKTFTWKHGRELSGMTDDSGTWSFEYNADGLRVYRSNGTKEYKYYYNGDKLSRMVVNGQNITFGYDANGTPQYVIYGDHRYVYLTNLQGDVTSIITVGGTTVVEYTYDAWGNILTVTGSMANTLGKENPLRYRGYVYDEETGLYYLQSRYYDPALGRFINADVYTSTGQDFVGNNMFAYCGNNPITRTDATGQAWLAAAVGGAIAGGLIGAASYLVSNGISGDAFDVGKFASAVGIGAVNGAIGGAAGTMKLFGKTAWSLAAGTIAGVYTAINTDGTFGQKIRSGVLTGVIAAGSTFAGASIDTAGLKPVPTALANYGTTIAVGTPAEFVAVATQTAITHNNSTPTTSSKPASPSRYIPLNYVALGV